jgi:hypothetical protein
MRTKFTKPVEWLVPFYDSVLDLVPADRILKIYNYRVPLSKTEHYDGLCHKYTGTKWFDIALPLDGHVHSKRKRYEPLEMQAILANFAHELAHTVHWEHTAEHFELTALIMLRFYYVMKQIGIIDTDVEVG